MTRQTNESWRCYGHQRFTYAFSSSFHGLGSCNLWDLIVKIREVENRNGIVYIPVLVAGGPADFYYLVREQDDRRGDPSVMNIIHYGTAVCLLFRVYWLCSWVVWMMRRLLLRLITIFLQSEISFILLHWKESVNMDLINEDSSLKVLYIYSIYSVYNLSFSYFLVFVPLSMPQCSFCFSFCFVQRQQTTEFIYWNKHNTT